jgi:cation diffusion facilitator family transporter
MTSHEHSNKRMPTPEQLKQERALAIVILLDLLLIVPYLAVGIAVGSLVMVAEVLRGGLLLLVICVSLRTLRRAHRHRTGYYEYGIGKLERALSFAVAVLLLLAAGFIFWEAFVGQPKPPPSRWLATLAVVFVCLNLGINTYSLFPMWRSLREEPSVIVLAHFRARLTKAVGSVVVVVCVAIHMFSSDPTTVRIAEAVGAVCVAGFMIVVAVGLLREAMPDLLDRAISEPMQMQVNRVLANFFSDYDELIAVRTRRSGNTAHVEITLGFSPEMNLGALLEILSRMQKDLEQAIPNSDILIVPRAAGANKSLNGSDN